MGSHVIVLLPPILNLLIRAISARDSELKPAIDSDLMSATASKMKPAALWVAITRRDCQEFRVRAVMMGRKEIPHGPTQGTTDS